MTAGLPFFLILYSITIYEFEFPEGTVSDGFAFRVPETSENHQDSHRWTTPDAPNPAKSGPRWANPGWLSIKHDLASAGEQQSFLTDSPPPIGYGYSLPPVDMSQFAAAVNILRASFRPWSYRPQQFSQLSFTTNRCLAFHDHKTLKSLCKSSRNRLLPQLIAKSNVIVQR